MRFLLDFLKKPTGQFAAIALFILSVSYVGRLVYVDQPRLADAQRARSGSDAIVSMADVLRAQADSTDDAEGFLNALPVFETWYPESLPCGRSAVFPGGVPFWERVGLKPGDATVYQYRWEREAGSFVIRARRDQDCDGLHATYAVTGTFRWPSAHVSEVEAQNSGE